MQGWVRQGMALRGRAWHCAAGRSAARHGNLLEKLKIGVARRGLARPGMAGLGTENQKRTKEET
jgi:hypothetical protein